MSNDIKTILIVLLIASLFIASTSLFVSSQFQDTSIDTEDYEYINSANSIRDKTDRMEDDIGGIGGLLVGAYQVALITLESVDVVSSMGTGIAQILGIPSFVVDIIGAIVSLIIIFGIIYIITGRAS